MKNYAGRVFADRYTLTRQIAVGAMGEVWAARDRLTHREIAIKVLRPELAGQATFLQRLRVEARNAMQISHPNLAAVLDHGEANGVGWIVMELVNGRPFNQYLSGGRRLDAADLLPILLQVAYALQAVNTHQVVHRDIKPSNVLVTDDGIVKLTDFGISTAPDQDTLTDAGMVMGTAQYLPPEQARGQEATHAGDLYALGVIAYEATAGRRPFGGETQVDVAFAHVNEPVPLLPEDVPAPVANIIYRLLRKDPKQRPEDALELVREITSAAQQLGVPTLPKPLTLPPAQSAQEPLPTASQVTVSGTSSVVESAPQLPATAPASLPVPSAPVAPTPETATPKMPPPPPPTPASPAPAAPTPMAKSANVHVQRASTQSDSSGPSWRHGRSAKDLEFLSILLLLFLVVFTVSAIFFLTLMRTPHAAASPSGLQVANLAGSSSYTDSIFDAHTPALTELTGRLMHTIYTEVPHHG